MGRFIRILRAKASDDVWNVAASGADLTAFKSNMRKRACPRWMQMRESDH
jgi:hypothetical protein